MNLQELKLDRAHALHQLRKSQQLLREADEAINDNNSAVYSIKELIELYDEYYHIAVRAKRNYDIADELYEFAKIKTENQDRLLKGLLDKSIEDFREYINHYNYTL